MVEWLAVSTGLELGKLVLGQVLDLSKPVLEGYVEDFFKDCLDSGVTRLKADSLKIPMAEAIGFFIKRFVKELQFNDVPDTSIEHHYRSALKRFVRDKTVGKLLGKAFETGCKQIDYAQLEHLWTQQYQESGWQFPTEEFDWRGVAKEYVVEVKGIIKANAEIRALLETDLLAEIAQNTAHISPGFDVASYKESLQASYGYLKLYTLDSTDRVDAIALWRIFIEQTVREALPPMRYELPLDLKRKLQDEGQLEDDLSPEALAHYRRDYFQQPARKVLEAVADSQRAIILGDPGAGKSTLLQYLALEWVEGNAEPLPLLIELREYVLAQSTNFLDFLERGRGADWQFDQQQLHQHLFENPTLIMFDGLDEVFDRATQATVIDDIIRFAQQYPQARVLVTSRIIGYNPERFQHAGFRQFTIQPLDEAEMYEFIEQWYDLSMGSDPYKARLKQRLKDAIANSKAIQNLADNPLLLTMMAILNRRQELPRDRADLYDQASRVLLYHWDVDHKRLQLPLDAIGRREKQEMLRLIAYEMQAGEDGLKGNLISADRLTQILTKYLRNQGFSESREKANKLIQQLRERNFILCYRGADTYGFVHRTFLEYSCAVEIVDRFEKQRILSFDQLRDEVFKEHWPDETWHEILRLICGMIDAKFTGQLIEFLIQQEKVDDIDADLFAEDTVRHLLLAIQCFIEVKNINTIPSTSDFVLKKIKAKVLDKSLHRITYEAVIQLAELFAVAWGENEIILGWLNEQIDPSFTEKSWWADYFAIVAIARGWSKSVDVFPFLKRIAQQETNSMAGGAAVEELVNHWKSEPETLLVIKRLLTQKSGNGNARQAAVKALVSVWKDAPDTLLILKRLTQQNDDRHIQLGATLALAEEWPDDSDALQVLMKIAQKEAFSSLRYHALHGIDKFWKDIPGILEVLCEATINDPFERNKHWEINPRQAALRALFSHYSTHPKTLNLFRDSAANDPDQQLREWAQTKLQILESEKGG